MASSSKGQRGEGWQTFGPYPRLMRSRFPDPLSPFGEISSYRSYPRLEYRSSSECVLLEHDDRQVSPPTILIVMNQSDYVTNFFKSNEAEGDVSDALQRVVEIRVGCVAVLGKCVSEALQS